MAIAAGNTVYWTSNGNTIQGVVITTPTTLASGLPNQNGGEPMYTVNTVTGPGTAFPASQVIAVRQMDVRSAA